MEMESSCVPPGFRFHPTEEELVGYYLKRKINNLKIDLDVIAEIDLYRMEPWDIEDSCRLGYSEQKEWYFFSHKDRKYPTGTRTNRATSAGFWKATGRDKAVLSKDKMIGMRKTLVFYKGRAPNGRKSDWIMHEYRLQTSEHGPPQEEGWVVCRAFKKPNPSHKLQGFEANWNYNMMRSNNVYTPPSLLPNNFDPNFSHATNSYQPAQFPQDPFETQINNVDLPKLDSPSISTSFVTNDNTTTTFTNDELISHEDDVDGKANFGNQFIISHDDWNYNKVFAANSEIVGSSSSSSYANYTINMPHNDDLSHVLECFPDL